MLVSKEIQIKDSVLSIPIDIHSHGNNRIIINIPGYGGTIDGFDSKYVKLADYICKKDFAAVIRMPNPVYSDDKYAYTIIKALESVIEYAIKNSSEICGFDNPDIYLIGTSAGGGASAMVAHKYEQIKKILLIAPAAGNVSPAGDAFKEIAKFKGEVSILAGEDDEVIGNSHHTFFVRATQGKSFITQMTELKNCNHRFTGKENGKILSRAPFWAFDIAPNFPNVEDEHKVLYDDVTLIENVILIEENKGNPVTYIPRHAEGNASHSDAERGIISSWNDKYVFVEYGTGTPKATPPELLIWG